jgi:flagellar FliJ protein
MAEFVYKMQNILDIKYKLENHAKTEYTNAQNQLIAEKQKMQILILKRKSYENALFIMRHVYNAFDEHFNARG